MTEIRKLKAVRAIVRTDKRADYLAGWDEYARAAEAMGARVWLFEDETLPGRFLEFTDFKGAPGMEPRLQEAVGGANLKRLSVRREGDDLLYREVEKR